MTNANMKSILFTIMTIPGSFAYVTSTATFATEGIISSAKPTFVRPPPMAGEAKKTSGPRQRYDLGLGKNPPVGTKLPQIESHDTDVYEATKYWMVPEAVNNYPSPLDKKKEKKSKLQSMRPSRSSEDVLQITKGMGGSAPTAIVRDRSATLEVNTVWLEMLIHHQQEKIAKVAGV